jgi:hypothetical protein
MENKLTTKDDIIKRIPEERERLVFFRRRKHWAVWFICPR